MCKMTTCKKEWILLCCLLAAAACQREQVGPDENGVQEVKTQFVMNISTGTAQTKQSAAAVQADGSFLGLDKAKLLTYALVNDGKILPTDQDAQRVYDLSHMMASAASENFNPRRILEMSLPLKTNTLLFYGKAPDRTSEYYNQYGHLDKYEVDMTSGSANFQLGKRLTDEAGFYATQKYLAAVLTVIMNTSYTEASYNVKWSQYVGSTSPVETGHPMYPLEEKLSRVYTEMTTIRYVDDGQTKEVELRAASGESILRMITDLWTVVNSVRCATPISDAETVAKNLASKIDVELQRYFSAASRPEDGSPVSDVSYKAVVRTGGTGSIMIDDYWPLDGDISDDAHKPSKQKPSVDELQKVSDNLKAFPTNYGIIRGATYITFDNVGKFFSYPKYFNTSAVGNPTDVPNTGYTAASYYYPAEILYFGNSPVRTSDLEHKTDEYPKTTGEWTDNDNWAASKGEKADWTGTHVASTTRSVAMKLPINYGVSMLETRVGYTDTVIGNGYLEDNNHNVQLRYNNQLGKDDEPNKKIALTNTSFKLVGVVIGGQHQNVGWDFLPIQDPTEKKDITGFIYDSAINGDGNVPLLGGGTGFSPNYTVVFDNFNAAGASLATPVQDKVYVALEFQNNTGEDFYGNFNMIRNRGYFYLIGEVDPAKGGAVTWPTDGTVIPPYTSEGTSRQIPRVFIQDYKTSVTFKFGPKSLQYAYLTVPDLRASSLTMGLSVDIEWKQGLAYDEVVIGGN